MTRDPFVTEALGLTGIVIGLEIVLCEVFLPQYVEVVGMISLGVIAMGSGLLVWIPVHLDVEINETALEPIRQDLSLVASDVEAIKEVVAPRHERKLAYEIDGLMKLLHTNPEAQETETEIPAET
jgi:hypothetical protein